MQSFKRLSRGLTKLADESEGFKSKTILGLLRGAPDLLPNVKQIEDMFQKPNPDDKSMSRRVVVFPARVYFVDSDELLPQKGKDKEYDKIVAEITGLEKEFDEMLVELEDKAGYVLP